ncbi:MAG: DUF4163 domain-containing protein [Cypionkella sp.]
MPMDCRPLAVLLLAACSSPAEVAERTGQAAEADATATSATAQAKKVEEDTPLYGYDLSYPAAVARIPALARRIEEQAAKGKAEMIADAKAAQAEAKASGFPFNPYGFGEEWQVVADLPGYLSLSNQFYSYTGGAHGMYGMEALVWDKANARGFPSEQLFQAPSFLGSIMGETLCDALDRERKKKGAETDRGPDPVFPPCPGLEEATILVGSSNGKTFDRITVWYGPYVAGSYAEGAYELDFPMTGAMLEAVKPAYRAAFSVKR